jgi:hypothetical protein
MHPIPCNHVLLAWEEIYHDYDWVIAEKSIVNNFSNDQKIALKELNNDFKEFYENINEAEFFDLDNLSDSNKYQSFRNKVLKYLVEFHLNDLQLIFENAYPDLSSYSQLEVNQDECLTKITWYFFWFRRVQLSDLNTSWNQIVPEYFNEGVIEKVFNGLLSNKAFNTVLFEITKLKQLEYSTFAIYSELEIQNKNLVNHQAFINRLNSESNFLNELGITLNNLKEKLRLSGYLIEYDLRIK